MLLEYRRATKDSTVTEGKKQSQLSPTSSKNKEEAVTRTHKKRNACM